MTDIYRQLTEKAKSMNALDVVYFSIDDIEFDNRTYLKCLFGCAQWGLNHTCPSRPGSLKPWEYKQIFSEYAWGLIIHTNNVSLSQEISFELERQAFLAGYYFAFSLSDCALCRECAGAHGEFCRNPQKARPAFHSVGIDVFKTVRKFDLPIETLRDKKDPQNWYSAVFVE